MSLATTGYQGGRETQGPTTTRTQPEPSIGHSGTTIPGTTTSAEGMTQHYGEKMKDMKDTAQHSAEKAMEQYMPYGTKENVRSAVRDTRSFYSRHPYVLPLLVLMSMLTGFSLGTMTTGGLWATSAAFGGYSRGSPEYEAHKKLDHILHSMYGQRSYMDKLGSSMGMGRGGDSGMMSSMWGGKSQGGQEGFLEKLGLSGGPSYGQHRGGGWFGGPSERSRTDEALSYMGDTLRGMKDRITPSQEQPGFGSYLSEHLPAGLGGKSEEYHRPQRSFLDKVRGLYSKSEWEKVDEAERKLREVLHAASQRGEL